MLEKHCFLFVFHAQNQNSQDFPRFELTAKMTSLSKNLGVNSAKNLDTFTSISTRLTKSFESFVLPEYHCEVAGSVGTESKKNLPDRSADSST